MVEKLQQVELRFWFFTLVIGFDSTVVNTKSGPLGGIVSVFCAKAEVVARHRSISVNVLVFII